MSDLLNCPFCGRSLVWSDLYSEYSHPDARCVMSGRCFQKSMIGQWNTRTPDPAVLTLVEAARGLMSALHTTRGTGRITQSVENTLDRIDAALAAFDKT